MAMFINMKLSFVYAKLAIAEENILAFLMKVFHDINVTKLWTLSVPPLAKNTTHDGYLAVPDFI